ncbi:histone deacetylase [Methanosarcinales archaeon]|nr:MAG: histone deacetylase [Methanosarcinales archaeon]
MRLGLVYDDRYLDHKTGKHPESPERVREVVEYLGMKGMLNLLNVIKPRACTMEEALRVHTEVYLQHLKILCETETPLDIDTIVSKESFDVALLAAGGLLSAAESILYGEVDGGVFALVRPPGHHAERNKGMGFCLLNNPAILASFLIEEKHANKVLIVDWDLHHGNGTQEIFYDNPNVLYISTHDPNIYPGTGQIDEMGEGAGEGFNVNIPMPQGSDNDDYIRIFSEIVMPIALQYHPDFVIVSAGFDIHRSDPLGTMRVTQRGFKALASCCVGIASDCCSRRIVFELEGGYNPGALAHSVYAVFEAMDGGMADFYEAIEEVEQKKPDPLAPLMKTLKDKLTPYWDV